MIPTELTKRFVAAREQIAAAYRDQAGTAAEQYRTYRTIAKHARALAGLYEEALPYVSFSDFIAWNALIDANQAMRTDAAFWEQQAATVDRDDRGDR